MSCGTCTLCCKVMGVPQLDPPKPTNQWCGHCVKGKGCSIYESRPPICSGFECLWLQATNRGSPLPDSLRPDRCKVVVAPTENRMVWAAHVDPGFPLAWREPKVMEMLMRIMSSGASIAVCHGDEKPVTLLRMPEPGKVRVSIMEMTQPDEKGMRHPIRNITSEFTS